MNARVARTIAIIQGHPDPTGHHLCHALADAYAAGAQQANHNVHHMRVAELDFPLLRSKEDFENAAAPKALQTAQKTLADADHLVIIYPLWLGGMPSLLKAFFEQIFRPGFAFQYRAQGFPKKLLKGKSARIIVTMGMPAFIYRWYFGAHSLKSLERNILKFCGMGPIKESLFGMVEAVSPATRQKWLDRMRRLGAAAS